MLTSQMRSGRLAGMRYTLMSRRLVFVAAAGWIAAMPSSGTNSVPATSAEPQGNGATLTLPGLVANRQEHWVRVSATATGLQESSPVEFLLIGPNSGKDYEALATSLAKPSDIHKALVFIGMQPGTPASQYECRFWPKGERVRITVEWKDGAAVPAQGSNAAANVSITTGGVRRISGESLVFDKRAGKQLPQDGFVFVGSAWEKSREQPAQTVYAADTFDPCSIVSLYNEKGTVFDVPRQAPQGRVYDSQFPDQRYLFKKGQGREEACGKPRTEDRARADHDKRGICRGRIPAGR